MLSRRAEWATVDARQTEQKVVHDARQTPAYAKPGKFMMVANRERGVQCHGQGGRHQNPACRSQPKQGGGRQSKWSNPNPARSSASASAAAKKARKNHKAVQ